MIALMMSSSAYALTVEELTPDRTDATMMAFVYIFGDVGGIFGTGTTSVLGDMFQIFNSAMMVVGGILITYIIMSGTLKTASEGELLGRQWSSIFIPIRAALAVGMIIPGPSGYALVQVFVMYCAITGVGLANKTWEVANQKILFGSSEVTFVSDGAQIIDGILSGYTCSAALRDTEVAGSGVSTTPILRSNSSGTTFDFRSCGDVSIPYEESGEAAIDDLYNKKIQMLSGEVSAHMQNIAEAVNSGTNDRTHAKDFVDVKAAYNAFIQKASKNTFDQVSKTNASYRMADDYGWLLAGGSYLNMAKHYKGVGAKASSAVKVRGPSYNKMGTLTSAEVSAKMAALNAFVGVSVKNKNEGEATASSSGNSPIDLTAFQADLKSTITDAVSEGSVPTAGEIIGPFTYLARTGMFNGGLAATAVGSKFTTDGIGNPLIQLMNFGDIVANVGMGIYSGYGAAMTIAAGLAESTTGSVAANVATAGSFNVGAALKMMAVIVTPFITMVTMSMVFAGLSMAIYLPLLPMIIWTLAVCGYFVLVIESMLAASVWAIMHASPDGHEWSGKGASGYIIILGMVLRPTLMIFGLVSALIVTNIAILVMKTMFAYSAGLVAVTNGAGPIAILILFFIFVWLAIKIVNRSLETITDVPSGIMKWIGGGHDSLGTDAAQSSHSFVASVMNRGEGGAQASLGAANGNKDKEAAKREESKKLMQQTVPESAKAPNKSTDGN